MVYSFNDLTPDNLLQIWENERKTRDFAVKLMWDNMKFFGALNSSLIAASIALLKFIFQISNHGVFPFDIRESTFILPAVIILVACYARIDLKERRRRFLLVVTHLLKLEMLLGLHEKISDKLTYFGEDEYLFVEYQKNLSHGKSKEKFIDVQMGNKENAFSSMQNIYILMMAAAASVIVLAGFLLFT